MFSRANLATKYKTYTKCLEALKAKVKAATKVPSQDESSLAELVKVLRLKKDTNAVSENCKKALCALQSKLQSYRSTEGGSTKFNRTFLVGAGLLGSKSPQTGYTDLDFLKELGIIESTAPLKNVDLIESTVPPENVSGETELANTPMEGESFTNLTSLYETNTAYTSIFDNMPPEDARNDLYTVLRKKFNASSEAIVENSSYQADALLETNDQFLTDNITLTQNDMSTNPDLTSNFASTSELEATNTDLTSNVASTSDLETTNQILTNNVPLTQNVTSTNPDLTEFVVPPVDGINTSSVPTDTIVEPIPEPPPIPDAAVEAVSQLNALGEPTFASLGLGGWTPVGLVQNCFEYLHVTLGIPWWEAVAIGTIIIRIFMFPLVIIAQRNAARMNNYMPQLQVLQLKMTEARQCGNHMDVARYSQEMMGFMKEKQLNPLKNMIVPLAQMPVFISFFVGLRQMANLPIESMRTGGLFWFTDLTVPDQFYALPIITSLTLWATIELGTDSAKVSSQNLQTMRYVLRALPVVILPFTVNFPGAILCYWVSSNFISLLQVGFLRIPRVRQYFNIEAMVKHNPETLPIKSKGFVGGIKDSWTNAKLTRELEERRRLDELQFQRAGRGPLVKTYKYDPTKQVAKSAQALSAKNR